MFCFPGGRAGDAPRTVAAHPPGVLDSVDLLVEPLAGLAAENGGTERDGERRDQRDEAAGRQGAAVDGQPREVQRVEHVVLRPADRCQCGDDDGDEDPPQPHADALPRAVEAGHPPGDVAAEEVADCQHDEQRDRCRAARRRLAYLREGGERWACGEATIAQEHFASNFLEGWMHTMARGWYRSGPRRAVLACVPGERHTLGLMAFGLAL